MPHVWQNRFKFLRLSWVLWLIMQLMSFELMLLLLYRYLLFWAIWNSTSLDYEYLFHKLSRQLPSDQEAYKSWILKRVYFSKIVQFKFWQDSILNSDWWNSFDSHQHLSLSSLKEMQNLSLVSELSDIKSLFDELVVVTSQTSEGKSKLGR